MNSTPPFTIHFTENIIKEYPNYILYYDYMKNTYKLTPEEHLRKNIMSIRWTLEETEWLKAFTSRKGVTNSKYVRAATFERLRQEGATVPLEKFE